MMIAQFTGLGNAAAEDGARLGATRLSFTHLDECLGTGALYAAARAFTGAVGYLATGSASSTGVEAATLESLLAWFARGFAALEPERVAVPA